MTNDISGKIDHTNLKPDASLKDISKLCKEAIDHKFVSVCIPPTYVSHAKKLIKDSAKICTVVGFPFGFEETVTKIAAIKKAVENGADELDVVINIGKLKSGDWEYVSNEIDQLVTITKHKYAKVLKLIFETYYLSPEELAKLCEICNLHELDFAKTSTGFAKSGATIDTVKKMRSLLNNKIKIKASGGIYTASDANSLIEAGADRIGASKSLTLIGKNEK